MQRSKLPVVDGLVVRDAITEQVKVTEGIVDVSPQAAALDAGKSSAEAWQP
jgi:hypothetical protein